MLVLWAITPLSARAQLESTGSLVYGLEISGTLDAEVPRLVYAFEGLRGEVLSLSLTPTSGDLDPVLTVVRRGGSVIATQDDSAIGPAALLESLRVPASDTYYVVAGRFGYELGTTSGEFDLRVDRVGVSSESGSSLRYGDAVINNVTDTAPKLYYTFYGTQGDIVNIRMQRATGDLDPLLHIANSQAQLVASSDDIPGASSLDAAVDGFVVEQTGFYVIIATRYGEDIGTTSGSFVLSVDEAENSGIGNTPLTAAPLVPGEVVEGEITNEAYQQYYAVQARVDDVLNIRLTRLGGSLDPLVSVQNTELQTLASDDDSGIGQNARLDEFLVPFSGTYYIVATRYQGPDGETTGAYRLEVQSFGNAFGEVPLDVPRLTYGSTITGVINDEAEAVRYVFWGVEGDELTLSMNRADGNLDPFLSVTDVEGNRLISDDDGGGSQNARIERFRVPVTGVYYVEAARYTGPEGSSDTRGSFVLVLARRTE